MFESPVLLWGLVSLILAAVGASSWHAWYKRRKARIIAVANKAIEIKGIAEHIADGVKNAEVLSAISPETLKLVVQHGAEIREVLPEIIRLIQSDNPLDKIRGAAMAFERFKKMGAHSTDKPLPGGAPTIN